MWRFIKRRAFLCFSQVVPVSLAEVYLLQLNLRFPTQSSFLRVIPLLNVTVATLHPLSDRQVADISFRYCDTNIWMSDVGKNLTFPFSFLR